MSYYECPKTYGEYTFDWNQMKNAYSNTSIVNGGVTRLLRELGKEGNLKINYGIESSGTDTKRYYKRTFKTFEYNAPGDFKTFSTSDLEYWIKKNKPVLVRGNYDNGNGHLWVVDGLYCDFWRYSNALGDVSYYGEGTFFHIVWGWGGICNGYFKHGSGFTQNSNKFTDENDLNWNPNWESLVKIYKLEFCGDINPR